MARACSRTCCTSWIRVDPEFSSWLTAKRKTLQERLLRQLEAQLRRDVQEEQDSLRMARVILNLDPSHEEACRSIMRTLAARGDATGAGAGVAGRTFAEEVAVLRSGRI